VDRQDPLAKALSDIEFLRSPEGYLRAGYPRFFSYFTRDACISAWQMLGMRPDIARDTLLFAARHAQGAQFSRRSGEEPGKFCHQAYGSADLPTLGDKLGMIFYGPRQYFAIDTTPLFVILAHRYWKRLGEAAVPVILELRANLASALAWLTTHLRQDGFLVYRKRNPFGFSHQGWRDGIRNSIKMSTTAALVDVQAYAYAALRAGAELFEALFENRRYGLFLENEAAELRMRFERFWWPEAGTYVFALAGRELAQVKRVTPDPGMCLFSGIIPDDKVPQVVERIFRPDLWTPYGLRSLGVNEELFRSDSYHNGSVWPWQNWLIWKGLRAYGILPESNKIRDAMLRAYFALCCMPETYGVRSRIPLAPFLMPNANPIQAWSAGAILDMITADES